MKDFLKVWWVEFWDKKSQSEKGDIIFALSGVLLAIALGLAILADSLLNG